MGCYNSVLFECQHCENEIEAQSKSGSCSFTLRDISKSEPEDIVGISEYPIECPTCKKFNKIKTSINYTIEKCTYYVEQDNLCHTHELQKKDL